MKWVTIDRPGYFGAKRDEIVSAFNSQYGQNNWRLAWEWGRLTVSISEARILYEDAYYEYLKANRGTLDWLVSQFENVFDNARSNVDSGFDYDIQEARSAHLQDIAIRRAVLRLGFWFSGSGLLEVRSSGEGVVLSPGNVPFHLPDLIYRGETKYQGELRDFSANPPWWIKRGIKNSVEEFYQQNKVLQVREL